MMLLNQKPKKTLFICLVSVSLILISGCQINTSKNAQEDRIQQRNTSAESLSDRQRAELYRAILAAELALGNEDFESALTHYLYSLTILPDSKIAEQTIQIAQKLDDPFAMLQAADAWLNIEPMNLDALLANILSHLKLNKPNSAYITVTKLMQYHSDPNALFNELSGLNRLYLHKSTISLWQELTRKFTDNPLGLALLAHAQWSAAVATQDQTYFSLALKTIEQSLQIDPLFLSSIKLKVQMMHQQNQSSSVSQYLNELLEQHPNSPVAISMAAKDSYRQQKFHETISQLEKLQKQGKASDDDIYLLAASYYSQQQFDKSYATFLRLVNHKYRTDVSYYFCGDTAERIGRFKQSIACYKKVEFGKYWFSAQRQLSLLLIKQKRADEALNRLDTFILNSDPKVVESTISLKAELMFQIGRNLQAIEWLSRHITSELQSLLVPQTHLDLMLSINPQLDLVEYAESIKLKLSPSLHSNWYREVAQSAARKQSAQQALSVYNHAIQQLPDDVALLYGRALIREQTDEFDLLEKELKHVLTLSPENPHVKNALGYTLADSNKELDYALQLINEAVTELPNSAAVQDSLGWVYFRKGKLEDAEVHIRRSLQIEFTAEVAIHLLEVLLTQNKTQEASTLLDSLWKTQKENKHLQSVIKRFHLSPR